MCHGKSWNFTAIKKNNPALSNKELNSLFTRLMNLYIMSSNPHLLANKQLAIQVYLLGL